MVDTIVVGGGPGGMMAAYAAHQKGERVLLLEQNDRLGKKLLITGKGRCNVTNACEDVETLIQNVPTNGNFLYSAFYSFTNEDTMRLYQSGTGECFFFVQRFLLLYQPAAAGAAASVWIGNQGGAGRQGIPCV